MAKDVIIALDFPNREETMDFLKQFNDEGVQIYAKVGMRLFYKEGPSIVKEIKEMGHKVFLDLKLHDIPNTVHDGIYSCLKIGVDMLNVHAVGGIKMMEAAMKAFRDAKSPYAEIIAVTILTSMSQEEVNTNMLIPFKTDDAVLKLATNTRMAGMHGVVCSALEVQKIKANCGNDFLTITPGIRYPTDAIGDQHRVVTPAKAREFGSDYIVVGRPIRNSDNPVKSYKKFKEDFLG